MCNEMKNQNPAQVPQELLEKVAGGRYEKSARTGNAEQYHINAAYCAGCGNCTDCCPMDAIERGNGVYVINDWCIGCGACVAACPVDCISR